MKIFYDLVKGWRCTVSGVPLNGNPPVLRYKEKPVWTLRFLKDGAACGIADFSGAVSFRAAVDVDLNAETEVICRTTDESIGQENLSSGELVIPVNANTSGFRTASDGQESRKAFFELWGFNSSADPVFYVRFEIRISGVVDPEGGLPPESVSPDSITRSEIMGYLRAPDERQFTIDPDNTSAIHSSQTSDDRYTRRRNSAAAGEWGPWEALVPGPQGDMPVISGGSATVLPPESMPTMDVRSAGSAYFVDFGIPEGKEGSLSAIAEYSVSSAYAAMTCLTYQGGGYQVLSATSAGENPDTSPEKFVCFAKAAELQGASAVVSYLTSGRMVIPGCEPFPVALQTHAGKFYPVEKETVTRSSGNWYIDPAPYLAYDNVSAFAGSWTVYLAGGGAPGPKGDMPVLSAGSATVLPPGSSPSVDVISSGSAYYLDLGIPQGEKGDPPVLSGGTVSTLPPGTPASASVSSTGSGTYRMDLSIPSGSRGEKGDTGDLLTVKQFITPEDVTSSNTVVFPGEKTLLTLLAPGGNAYTVRDDDVRYTSSGTVLDMTRFFIGENISAFASSDSWTVFLADAAVPVVLDGGTVSSGYQADYTSGDVQKIKLAGSNADITLTASNIPLGKMMVLHVDNSAGANLIFRNNDLLVSSDTGKYMIGLANVTGSAFVYGTPVREIG